ncbi:25S rRNA (adenine645-N1)-methyltransferase [Lobulomyces angularis]|nr:25S rRNA (adenine645-N1)-methyltransferase [Lobulomyces angularis]
METKLKGAKFRWLNETLYTTESSESLKIFTEDPELFTIYHNGFRSQVQKWPVNPLSIFIKNLEKRRSFHGELVIADMGCGDAMISQTFKDQKNFKIHSFDLIAVNDSVTSCDIKHVPLKPSSVDIVVFCLSLMGTNFFDFIKEARRILKVGGEILIAEVESRFPKKRKFQEKDSLLSKSNNTKFFSEESENGIELFLKNLQIFGFELKKPVDFTYKVFILFHLVLKEKKTGSNGAKAIDGKSMLKPCLYKKR